MKILSATQIRESDAYTIKHTPIASIDLIERAANACADWLEKHFNKSTHFKIVCGLGNNGGDGLAIARLLAEKHYNVEVFIIRHSEKCSEDFKINEERLLNVKLIPLHNITPDNTLLNIAHPGNVIIDALFGSGLNKPIEGFIADIVKHINQSRARIISIDIPSGLFTEDNSSNKKEHIVRAHHTLTFEVPKLAFMFPENADFVGEFHLLNIGLDKRYMAEVPVKDYFITKQLAQQIFKPRRKFSHKGNYGHSLIVAGSYGKMGAAVLASKACLNAGAGLVTAHVPKCGYEIMQTSIPEVMISVDSSEHFLSDRIHTDKYNAIGVGPGLSNEKQTQNILKLLIQNTLFPMVIDADAINILSENKTWLAFIPQKSILTPHPKEFERLVGKTSNDYERYLMQKEFAVKYGVYVVLKGAHTSIVCPDGDVFFNSTGNPGMATAGSGDVLTGIITGLLAQSYTPKEASLFGVYLHGLAGDIAASAISQEAMIARDIINYLGKAFLLMESID